MLFVVGLLVGIITILFVKYAFRKRETSDLLPYTTLYINLDRRPDRRSHCENELHMHFGNIQRIAAVDGNFIEGDEKRVTRYYDNEDNARWDGSIRILKCLKMTPGELGCSLSHRTIWEMNYSMADYPIFVFEDDIVLASQFKEIVATVLQNLPKDCDILYLGYMLGGLGDLVHPLISRVRLLFGTYAYMLTYRGMVKLKTILPIDRPVDCFLGKLTESGILNGYACVPPVADQIEYGGHGSDIIHSAHI